MRHYIYIYITILLAPPRPPEKRAQAPRVSYMKEVGFWVRLHLYRVPSIFKLRISKFGVWVKRIIKRRRWIFLARRLIP